MTFADFSPLANHLWQSTLFVAVAWLLTLALRKNRAAVRYWLWLAASAKFLIPFCLLVSAGTHLGWRVAPAVAHSQLSFAMDEISEPFAIPASMTVAAAAPALNPLPAILLGGWLCGIAIGIGFWVRWWRQMRAILRTAAPLDLNLPIRVMSSPARMEPGVIGIFKPVLLLPEAITEHLTPAQLEGILAHELRHVQRRDNLTAVLHMLVETIFWFHPLVWWIRTRLMEERERACDEEVMRTGCEPQVYAESILKVCEFYLAASTPCAAGITGGELKKRIEEIMEDRFGLGLGFGKKILLASAAALVIAAPIVVGLVNPARGRAQTPAAEGPGFEAASVKVAGDDIRPPYTISGGPGTNDPGRFHAPRVNMLYLLSTAFDVSTDQIAGPGWILDVTSNYYTVDATIPSHATKDQFHQMLQKLLAGRFHLAFHREKRDFPAYELVVDKGGPYFKEVAPPPEDPNAPPADIRAFASAPRGADGFPNLPGSRMMGDMTGGGGQTRFKYQERTMAQFVANLGFQIGKSQGRGVLDGFPQPRVVDKTGLTGKYTFVLEFWDTGMAGPVAESDAGAQSSATASDPGGGYPDIFTAIRRQLGLRLNKVAAVPLDVIVVDSVDKVPTAN